jgi:hypothetical protein
MPRYAKALCCPCTPVLLCASPGNIRLSACLSVYPPVCKPLAISVCLRVSVCKPLAISIGLPVITYPIQERVLCTRSQLGVNVAGQESVPGLNPEASVCLNPGASGCLCLSEPRGVWLPVFGQ